MEECSWQGKEHVQRPLRVREHPPPLQSQALILAGSPSVSAVVSAEPWRGSPGDLGGPRRASNTMVRDLDVAQLREMSSRSIPECI